MKIKNIAMIGFILLLAPAFLYANEPLVPLIMLFLAPTTFGGVVFASFLGFLLILLVKCIVFILKSDFKTIRAVLYVLVANVVSTLVGTVVAMMFTSSDILFMGIIVLFIVFLIPARRLRHYKRFEKNSTWFIAFALTLITLITIVIFSFMIGYQASPHIYWPLKVILSTIAIVISLLISVLYEEAVIAKFYKLQTKEEKSFITPVLWSNIIGVGLIVLVGAIIALPARLKSPDFLIGLVRALGINV
jgi:hypothetical protein